MDALMDFLHMGGYAFYVWWSYAIVLVLLALNVALPLRRSRQVRERLRRLLGEPTAREGADGEPGP
jgi:heme exporter protein D